MERAPHRPAPSAHGLRWPSALLGLLVFAVFSNCLSNAFLWDDEQFILKNTFLTSPAWLLKLLTGNIVAGAGVDSNLYRPLQSLTHFLDVRLWGYQPWGHHLSSLLVHAATSAAVFRLLARLYPRGPAFLAAALFCLHPLHTEAVAYLSGRGDTLAILFLCLGLLSFRRHLWFCSLCAFLAIASKESLVLFPVFLFLYDRLTPAPAPLKRHLPLWLLSAGYVVARLTVLNFKNILNFYDQPNLLTEHVSFRLYTYLTTLPKGLLLWIWPADLHHERSWFVYTTFGVPQVWWSALLVAALLGVAVWLRRRARPVAVGLAWFFIATVPTSNLAVLINALFYDHCFLLPGLGLVLAIGHVLSRAFAASAGIVWRAAAALSLALISILAVTTWRYNRVWRDPITLYTYILSWEPRSAKIHHNLGLAYADHGRLTEAIQQYQRAVELDDEFPQPHHNLGVAYIALGDEAQAQAEFQRAVAISPGFYQSWLQLGALHLAHHELQEAAQAFEQARRAYPYAVQAYLGLAQVSLAQGDSHSARLILESGRHVLPRDPTLEAALQP